MRRPGFVKGRPGLWWSITGHLFPKIPMYVVRQGDVVAMHIANHSGEAITCLAITWSCWLAMVWRPAVAPGGSTRST